MADRFEQCLASHLDALFATAKRDGWGPWWPAQVDVRHEAVLPASAADEPGHTKRVYRHIDAPGGASFYWDQPLLVAAQRLSASTGEPRYADAAHAYAKAFFEQSVARNGVFLWGNHYYWDHARQDVVKFAGNAAPEPVDWANEQGDYHEMRPLLPAWGALWTVDATAVERHIRTMAAGHIHTPQTGGFNRHADGRVGHAFLEAGAILVDSLTWLAARTGDASLTDMAMRVAHFSFDPRESQTGLLPNDPTSQRWDRNICTTEVGLWADCLLNAADATGLQGFADMAAESIRPWLRFGWDESTDRLWGKLNVATGEPITAEQTTIYQPRLHSDPFEPLFPTHDYPLPFANACLRLMERTGDRAFVEGVQRLVAWLDGLNRDQPVRDGQGAYAEHYGRVIEFLRRAAKACDEPDWHGIVDRYAAEAMDVLWVDPMFRTHPGEDRYEAVDGLGVLACAMMAS